MEQLVYVAAAIFFFNANQSQQTGTNFRVQLTINGKT